MPRPAKPLGLVDGGTLAFACQVGIGKVPLTPLPVAPSLLERSFHTTSLEIVLPLIFSVVPPQASAYGLDAGKSTWSSPSVTPSVEPSSPAATQTLTPTAAAACSALLNDCSDCAVQLDSGPPQLIDRIDGLFTVSFTAWLMASRKPASVLGAKYTAMLAPEATEPTTSMSSMTSVSGPF